MRRGLVRAVVAGLLLIVMTGCGGAVSRSRGTVVVTASGEASRVPGRLRYKLVLRSGSTLLEYSGQLEPSGGLSRDLTLPEGRWLASIEVLSSALQTVALYEGSATVISRADSPSPVRLQLLPAHHDPFVAVVGSGSGRITAEFAPPPIELSEYYGIAYLWVSKEGREVFQGKAPLVAGGGPARFELSGLIPGQYSVHSRFLRPDSASYFTPRVEAVTMAEHDTIHRAYTAPVLDLDDFGRVPPASTSVHASYSKETGLVTITWDRVPSPQDDIAGYRAIAWVSPGETYDYLGPWSPEATSAVIVPDRRGKWRFRIETMTTRAFGLGTEYTSPIDVQ